MNYNLATTNNKPSISIATNVWDKETGKKRCQLGSLLWHRWHPFASFRSLLTILRIQDFTLYSLEQIDMLNMKYNIFVFDSQIYMKTISILFIDINILNESTV